jgi:5-amino-6-(5-phosphoribosylamino)uracil reductase/2,5-diamino-6-(ribosylamino)-4(3H)-pyrimidinone 5'-phosphate reductase
MHPFPRISANFAISADGKISDEIERPTGWTSREDHARLIKLRRGADALLVGRRTLLADRMTLRVRDQDWQPLRCVVTNSGGLTGDEPLFHESGGRIHILCPRKLKFPVRDDITLHHGTLAEFLASLHLRHGVNHLHCEGGGGLMKSLIEIHPPDLLYLTWAAHTFFGGSSSPTLSGKPSSCIIDALQLPQSIRYRIEETQPTSCGREMFLTFARD